MAETTPPKASHRKGTLERPRTLFLGAWSTEEVTEIEKFIGHSRRAHSFADVYEKIPAAEIDLVLVKCALESGYEWETWQHWCRRKFVVHFPSGKANELLFPAPEEPLLRQCHHIEFSVTADAGELPALARRSTADLATAEGLPRWERPPNYAEREMRLGTWLVRTDEGMCAFHFEGEDSYTTRGLLVVPTALCKDTPASQWISAALRTWRPLAEDIFPRIQTWRGEERWWTAEQQRLEHEIAQVRIELAQTQKALARKEALLVTELHHELIRAEEQEGRLLTAQGADLVDAASEAFLKLGFSVEIPAEEGTTAKAEDLVLSRDGWDGWSASVEVKGFATSSAKLPDAIKLDRRRTRRGSLQALLVVNGEFGTPPPQRHSLFQANREAQDVLAELSVLVIDSRDLYQALAHTDLAALLVEAIRETSGVFVAGDGAKISRQR